MVLAVGSLVTACGDTETTADGRGAETSATAGAVEASESPAAAADVKIVSAGFEDHETWGKNAYVVRWKLTNTGKVQGGFYAGLDFLDKDGDVLGSTGITAEKVGPGKTAKGETAPLDVEIDKGKMSDIKGVKVTEVEPLES
jgi:hypothetical protein